MSVNIQSLIKKKFPSMLNVDVISEINYLGTSIPALNYILSGKPYSGGLPLNGKICTIYGVEGASKSTMCINIIAEAQKQGYTVIYVDTEASLTRTRMEQFSIDVDDEKFVYCTPVTMEEVFDLLEAVCNEKIKEQDDSPMLIVWDSIGSTATEEETSRTMHDIEMASTAKVLSRSLKKMVPILHKLPHTGCLFVQQSRQNLSLYGDTIKLVGGQQLLHSATIIVRVGKQKAGIDGQICVYSTQKNKCFSPFQKTEIHLDYAKGFTKEAKITSFCEMLKAIGLLVQAGSYCGYSDELKKIITDNKFNSDKDDNELFDVNKKYYMKDFVKQLENDDEFYTAVLKSSEEYIQQNLVFVTNQCKDETAIEDDNGKTIGVKKPVEESDPAEQMFDDMENISETDETSKSTRKKK